MKRKTKNIIPILKTFYILCLTLCLLLWINHDSVNLYWIQTYHSDSLLSKLDAIPAWKNGEKISGFFAQGSEKIKKQEEKLHAYLEYKHARSTKLTKQNTVVKQPLKEKKKEAVAKQDRDKKVSNKKALGPPLTSPPVIKTPVLAQTKPAPPVVHTDGFVTLQRGNKVFFAGDSLMQGVAPRIKSSLYALYKIKSIDLSKQSTGLSYPGFFNWPETIKTTLENNPDITLMVVMMGPNDPWDIPDKQHPGHTYIKFKSPEWEVEYRERIQEILETAKKYNIRVIWIGAPNMRKEKLNTSVRYLDTLYKDEVIKYGNIYLDVNDVLGNKEAAFSSFIMIDDKKQVKVRSDDGIHFTITGQRQIAKKLMSLLKFNEQNVSLKND